MFIPPLKKTAILETCYSYEIYSSINDFPKKWDELTIKDTFFSRKYLKILEESSPDNIDNFFIGLFENKELIGTAIIQFLDLNKLNSFGSRDKCIKSSVRNFLFKKFSSNILIIGNTSLTGQNAIFISKEADKSKVLNTLEKAIEDVKMALKNKGIKIHLTSFKDFHPHELSFFDIPKFDSFLRFFTQPNMILYFNKGWKTEQDYLNALSKKYRNQYTRARKKATGIVKKQLALEEINELEDTIYNLYLNVANNAPFNTFFLPKNHFSVFKNQLGEDFLFYGYFEDDILVGFNTLIRRGENLDAYFLGYDSRVQKEKMLYLNMLYDMVIYGAKNHFEKIIFRRTALEIKSSVGAIPINMYGLMQHSNWIINRFLRFLFNYLEPKTIWEERNPFE